MRPRGASQTPAQYAARQRSLAASRLRQAIDAALSWHVRNPDGTFSQVAP